MTAKLMSRVLLYFPVFILCQEYRVDYLCDFENGDCGLITEPDTGAEFRRQEVQLGQRNTRALVLEPLTHPGNWSYGRPRSAVIWTPVILPSGFFSPVFISLDLFLDAGDCLQYFLVAQQVGEGTRTLEIINESSDTSWNTLNLRLLNRDNPIKLKFEARLLPNCQDLRSCSCGSRAALDNLRIRTAESPDFESDQEDENQVEPAARIVDRRSPAAGGAEERQVEEQTPPTLERQTAGHSPYPQQYSQHWAHKWKLMGKGGYQDRCPPPNCDNLVVVHVNLCPTEQRDCIYVNQAPCCNCPTVVYPQCPKVECPRVLECDRPPPCPPTPPFDPKTWDPKSHHPY